MKCISIFYLLLMVVSVQGQFTHPMIFEINSPSNIQGSYPFGSQTSTGWGITALPSASVTGQVVWAYDITLDSLNCDTIVNDYTGKIVMVRRGACEFALKVLNSQRAGAIGCIVCNNNGSTDVINMGGGATGSLVTMQAVMLSSQNCALIAARLAAGDNVFASFKRPQISGNIWNDINTNCQRDSGEANITNRSFRLLLNPGNLIVQSSQGFWSVDSLPLGNYTITLDTTNNIWAATCSITQTFSVTSNSAVNAPNFGMVSRYTCTVPNVSIVMPRMRRGFSNQTITVSSCNENTATNVLYSAFTIVTLPSQIILQTASIPYTSLGNNRYRFDHDSINIRQCINFTLNTTVTTATVNGQTLCLSAELFPQADCVFDSIPIPYPNNPSGTVSPCTLPWDRSSLRVEGECVGDSVRFVIYNTGVFGGGDMDCFAPVRVYVDGTWIMLDSIRIVGGDSVVFMFAGTGGTIRLEADQHPLHPGNSHPNANVENCGNGTWTPGIINAMPQNDADPVIDIFCGQVTAPTDPNDKTGFPLGVGSTHAIRQNQQIEYLIRFQNVGTDTAFNIVIRDTLSTDLNIFTVQSEVASHPYEFRMYGPRILEWRFDNIMLPDSNVNESASHGFVKFTVQQNPNLPFGTVIENNAAIYFDFEAPVITNTYFHTISDFTITVSVEPIESSNKYVDVKVFPNPFNNQATLQIEGLDNTENLELEIFSLNGQRIQQLSNSQNGQFYFSKGEMSQGIYLFTVKQVGKIVARGKMVVE